MKHIFYIHSYITYIVAVSVVAELALDHRDVVFIYGRSFHYRDIPDIAVAELPSNLMALSRVPSYGKRFIFFRKHRDIKALDKLIGRLTQSGNFTAYLPLTKNYLMQLIVTHPQCGGLIFLEEGLLSYTGNFVKNTYAPFVNNWRGKLAALSKYPNHGYRSYFYRSNNFSQPLSIYMLHEAPDIRQANIDVRVLKSVVVPSLDPQFQIDDSYLFIVETVIEDGIVSADNYFSVLETYIDELKKHKVAGVWIRFRPNYPASGAIIALFNKRSIHVDILPDEICIESVLSHSKNLTVAGLHSSLLFYAAIWGHTSLSLLKRLFQIDNQAEEKYQKYLHIPGIFYEKVNLL